MLHSTSKIKLTSLALALALVSPLNAEIIMVNGAENEGDQYKKNNVNTSRYGLYYLNESKSNDNQWNIKNIQPNSVNGIIGGLGKNSNANDNNIIIDYIHNIKVYGGDSLTNVKYNSVTSNMNKITVEGDVISDKIGDSLVYGGLATGAQNTGYMEASKNIIKIEGSVVQTEIIGGKVYSGITVVANKNQVKIKGDVSNSEMIAGGYIVAHAQNKATVNENKVEIKGHVENSKVYGGYSKANRDREGFRAETANNNNVIIHGNLKDSDVWGGKSYGSANNNNITLHGDIIGKIYGGDISGLYENNSAINNNVYITADADIGSKIQTEIYGGKANGYRNQADTFTGNTLFFSGYTLKAKTIGNFENYNFTLDPRLVNTDTASITSENIELGNREGTVESKINVVGIKQGNLLKADDKFLLIKSEKMTGKGKGDTFYGVAQQGISVLYDVKTEVDTESGKATAIILSNGIIDTTPIVPAGRVNPQLKALSEGHLADLMLLTRGADMVAYSTFDTIKDQNLGGFVPFAQMGGSHNRYDSGSHIKSNDFFIMTGVSYRNENLTTALFAEAGWGNYDTKNSFNNAADVRGDGDNRYVGIGTLGKYEFSNNLYVDGSFRIGKSHNKFHTEDIRNMTTNETARYSFSRTYVGAHAGLGYIYDMDAKNNIDFSAKYLWAHLGSKNISIAGDNLKFKGIESNRIRLQAMWNHQYTDSTKFKLGAGYEYEFSAKAKAVAVDMFNVDAPSAKGSTGILTMGVKINPESNKRLSIDFNVNGYAGKRDGVSANVKMEYQF